MGNGFCHVELSTSDLKAAREFYGQMFDWQIQEFPGGEQPYFLVNTGSEPAGGMMGLPMPGVPVAWTMYILVEDLDAACAKALDLGGKLLKERTPVTDMGWFAIVSDPQGACFGLWQAKM